MNTFALVDLPREVRDQILGEVLFPGEKEPNDVSEQDYLGLAPTAVRQIFPYDISKDRKLSLDVAIVRTCKQLQHEAEWILYGTSSWNLMYEDWSDGIKKSYEFFEKFPRRLRRLVQRVERKCYSRPYRSTISLHDWTMFMTFLARECPLLYSLKLWGPGDADEGPEWVETCGKEEEWVQAILQIKTLKYFDIPVIKGGIIYRYPAFADDFLPWLKTSLINASRHSQSGNGKLSGSSINSDTKPFLILRLDKAIRERIYRHVLLPPHKGIHPYIKTWYDITTSNIIPLFLTCKQIHEEAEYVFYSEAIFTSRLDKYNTPLVNFLQGQPDPAKPGLPPCLRPFIKHIRCDTSSNVFGDLYRYLLSCPDLTAHITLNSQDIQAFNRDWENSAPNSKADFRSKYFSELTMCFLARINKVVLETPEGVPLNAECHDWVTRGLREEYLHPCGDERLAWVQWEPDLGVEGDVNSDEAGYETSEGEDEE